MAKEHQKGHRKRLRQRFLTGGADALPDYELLELILFTVIPRRDVKPLAKKLIKKFGSFAGVIQADVDELQSVDGIGRAVAVGLKTVRAAALRLSQQELQDRPVIGSWQSLIDYCHAAMARSKKEEFRILFLNKRNKLIRDEVMATGTIDHAPVYPREVVKRALELGATAIILVHNHPSGDPTPSRDDIRMTKRIRDAANGVDLKLYDHLIIAREGHASLKNMGLI
jgi:DNA repair protein RadC